MLKYEQMKGKGLQFKSLVGMSVEAFDWLHNYYEAEWNSYIAHYTLSGVPRIRSHRVRKDGKLESGSFVVDMNTLTSVDLKDDTENLNKLNGHLKSGDFFETEKFPTASYVITKVTAQNEGDYNTLLDGNLTIKGITKPVAFQANVSVKDDGVTIASEPKDIKREDFGVKFQLPAVNGLIKDEVNLQILIKANQKK